MDFRSYTTARISTTISTGASSVTTISVGGSGSTQTAIIWWSAYTRIRSWIGVFTQGSITIPLACLIWSSQIIVIILGTYVTAEAGDVTCSVWVTAGIVGGCSGRLKETLGRTSRITRVGVGWVIIRGECGTVTITCSVTIATTDILVLWRWIDTVATAGDLGRDTGSGTGSCSLTATHECIGCVSCRCWSTRTGRSSGDGVGTVKTRRIGILTSRTCSSSIWTCTIPRWGSATSSLLIKPIERSCTTTSVSCTTRAVDNICGTRCQIVSPKTTLPRIWSFIDSRTSRTTI